MFRLFRSSFFRGCITFAASGCILRYTLGSGISQPSRLVPGRLIRPEQAISAQQKGRGNQAAPKSPSPGSRSESLRT
ncbi:hypothetical protein BDV11DRAFT_179481 [Aspergillus similis]